jgi:hypothetical protein
MSALLFGAAALPQRVQPASASARACCAARCTALAARRASCHAGAQLPAARTAGKSQCRARGQVAASAALKALLWDCDGVILESEDLHRRAYNAVFAHYDVRVDGKARACVVRVLFFSLPHVLGATFWCHTF